ncbi:MAG: PH domain-containing protein, partial [Erythrobacter sp.]|nr:PH domain-containing protein [Erythrobacter sp.]
LQQAIFPALAATFGIGIGNSGVLIGLMVAAAVISFSTFLAYLAWSRLTYTVGAEDIRVESGIVSRTARSVPYERIQDVSLEQKLLPRLFGLVSVKFETGAGGGDDLTLTYLTSEAGERLRQLVRERREEAEADQSAPVAGEEPEPRAAEERAEALFAMGPRRLLIFGLFEFSLAVFAVLGGLLQYAETFLDIEVWDVDFWRDLAAEQGGWILELGLYAQALGAALGLGTVALIGSATGLVRTFSREWGFLLERTSRGFRRRRGLFTRTDVVMPIHRVQALRIDTQLIRYRFGWHSARFISLAQDAGSSSHVVAPFAKMEELAPIVSAAGFRLPREDAEWHRASAASRTVSLVIEALVFLAIAAFAGSLIARNAPEWTVPAVALVLGLGVLSAGATLIAWRFKRHALDADQIMVRSGFLSPDSTIATRVKLHSVEIAQGPIARRLGYATLHLGLAGGELSIPGIPLERAREVRARILETITATDFSRLESA